MMYSKIQEILANLKPDHSLVLPWIYGSLYSSRSRPADPI